MYNTNPKLIIPVGIQINYIMAVEGVSINTLYRLFSLAYSLTENDLRNSSEFSFTMSQYGKCEHGIAETLSGLLDKHGTVEDNEYPLVEGWRCDGDRFTVVSPFLHHYLLYCLSSSSPKFYKLDYGDLEMTDKEFEHWLDKTTSAIAVWERGVQNV